MESYNLKCLVFSLLSLCLGIAISIVFFELLYEPETEYIVKYKDRATTEYIDRIVYEKSEPIVQTVSTKEIIEVPTYKPLRDFESLEVLQSWLNENGGFIYVLNSEGTITLGKVDDNNDCDDQARRLQEKAFADGYNLSLHLVDKDGYLMNKKVTEGKLPHMANLAIIRNDIYYVDGVDKEAIWISYVD